MAFKIAGSMALRKAVQDAKPILLEPIMKVEVITPDDTLGAVIGDLNSKRGRVQGVEPQAGGNQKINAQVPMSEMLTYANQLHQSDLGQRYVFNGIFPLRRTAKPSDPEDNR